MNKNVGKRILAVFMSVCMLLGMADFSVLTVKAADPVDLSTKATIRYASQSLEYTGEKLKPSITVRIGTTTLTEGTDYTVAWPSPSTDVGDYEFEITGTGNYSGTKKGTYKITPRFLSSGKGISIDINEGEDLTVIGNGVPVKPEFTVSYNGTPLNGEEKSDSNTSTVDYIFEYKNNTTVRRDASIVITGKGNYQGTMTKTFEIKAKSMDDVSIEGIDGIINYTGDKAQYKPENITLSYNGETMTADDYTISYSDTSKPGKVTVTITGKGNYSGTRTEEYIILKDMAGAGFENHITTSPIGKQVYTGQPIQITGLIVYDLIGGKPQALKEETHYYLQQGDNVDVTSTATFGVAGIEENGYAGSKTFYYEIEAADIKTATVEGIEKKVVYTGQPHDQIPKVLLGETEISTDNYDVAYRNTTNAGTGYVDIKGKNNLKNSRTESFTIDQQPLDDTDHVTVTLERTDYSYDGAAKTPGVTVTYTPEGESSITLEQGDNKDYTVRYDKNINAGTVDVLITGRGNYKNTRVEHFDINPRDITSAAVEGIVDAVYTGSAIDQKGLQVSLDEGRTKLVSGTDYRVTYENNIGVGTATLTITGINNYTGEISRTFEITKKVFTDNNASYVLEFTSAPYNFKAIEPSVKVSHLVGTQTVVLEQDTDYTLTYDQQHTEVGIYNVTVTGIGNFDGSITRQYRITPMELDKNKAYFTFENMLPYYPYTGSEAGKEVQPADFSIKYQRDETEAALIFEQDYTREYANNTAPGTGKIIIKGVDGSNFTGTLEQTFQIKGDLYSGAAAVEGAITEIKEQVYTGSEISLENDDLTIVYKPTGTTLTLGTDYTLDNYQNNVEPGEGTASVRITGTDTGNYYSSTDGSNDEIVKHFTILKKDIGNGDNETDVKVELEKVQEYTGSPIVPKLKVTYGNLELTPWDENSQSGDYMVVPQLPQMNNTNAGKASIVISGTGVHYQGTQTVEFEIVPRDLGVGTIEVADIDEERIYHGTPVKVKDDEKEVTFTYTGKDTDGNDITLNNTDITYQLTYNVDENKNNIPDNEEVGMATLRIKGTGPNFTGQMDIPFKVKGDLATYASSVAISVNADRTYTGNPQELTADEITVTYYGQTMIFGTDYTLEYPEGNTDATEAVPFTVKSVTGDDSFYMGDKAANLENAKEKFQIKKKPIADLDIEVEGLLEEGYTYTGEEIHPEEAANFALKYGEFTLEKGVLPESGEGEEGSDGETGGEETLPTGDYTLRLENPIDVVDLNDETIPDEAKPSIVVTATEKNYTGTRRIIFKINPRPVNTDETVVTYVQRDENGENPTTQTLTPNRLTIPFEGIDVRLEELLEELKVTCNNILLEEGKDYRISYLTKKGEEDVASNHKPGNAVFKIEGIGNYGETKEIPFLITGDLSSDNTAVEPIDPQPYTAGDGCKPKVKVTYYGVDLIEDEDYRLSYLNNKNVAKDYDDPHPTVVITGINGFAGTQREEAFEIVVRNLETNPEGMTLEGLNANGYAFTGLPIEPTGFRLKNNGEVVNASEYEVSYENNIHGGGPDSENPPCIIITGKYDPVTQTGGNYTGSMRFPFTIVGTPITNSAIKIAPIAAQQFTGGPIEPEVVITQGDYTLVKETDYRVEWDPATNIAVGRATGTIYGLGDYSGTRNISFNITRRDMGTAEEGEFKAIIQPQNYDNGNAVEIPPEAIKVIRTVNETEMELVYDTDYRISSYQNNKDVGEALVTITGLGNYTGTFQATFNIQPMEINIDDVAVTGAEDRVFNNAPQTQNLVVTWNGQVLPETTYEISYENNINVGTATAIVTLTGNYSGTKSVNFAITPLEVTNSAITVKEIPRQVYTGKALTPEPEIYYNNPVQREQVKLVSGKDYQLSYSSNQEVGINTAKVTITGIGNYSGSMEKSFTIIGTLALAEISAVPVQEYTGKAITPSVTVKQGGRTLTFGTDYTISYANNVEAGKASLTVTGTGTEFGGSKTVNFDIVRDVSAGLQVVGLVKTYLYTGKAVVPPLGKVSAYGKTLTPNKDYKITVSNNVKVGTASVKIEGTGYYKGSKTFQFDIAKRSIAQCTVSKVTYKSYNGKEQKPKVTVKYNGQTLKENTDYSMVYMNNTLPGKATIIISGKGNMIGTKVVNFNIKMPAISGVKASPVSTTQVKISWKKQSLATGYKIYNNKNKLVATVKGGSKTSYTIPKLKAGTTYNYKVRFYVVKNGRTCYSGFSKTMKVSTKPAAPKITLKSKKAKQATISWKKVTGATGYEIYRSTKKSSGYKKIATTSKLTYTNTKLTSKKRYYYKVRTYRTVNGVKIYSSYSTVKYVTIK